MFTLMTHRRSLHNTAAREEVSIPSSRSSRVSWRRGERRSLRRVLKCCWRIWGKRGERGGMAREGKGEGGVKGRAGKTKREPEGEGR